jgi:hypothetical protein
MEASDYELGEKNHEDDEESIGDECFDSLTSCVVGEEEHVVIDPVGDAEDAKSAADGFRGGGFGGKVVVEFQ